MRAASLRRWLLGCGRDALSLPTARGLLTSVVVGIILAVVVVTLVLWTQLEKRFVFFPTSELEATPEQAGLDYEDVIFTTEDGLQLHGWFVPGTTEVTWLWFHGNGGNIGHRVDELALVHHRLGVNVFIFDYRGYGRSQGQPSERGTYRDSRAALSYLRSRADVSPGKIVYFGRSLGSAVAVELAVENAPAAMVLVSPFASIRDMARISFPLLPFHWLVRNHYNSLAHIAHVRSPLMVLHGERDETVPLAQGKKLFDAANAPKKFQVLTGTGHNDTYLSGGTAYWNFLEAFLAEQVGKQPGPGAS